MTVRIYIPRDAAAIALGAEKVVEAMAGEIAARGLDATIVRNGSRGMHWLEPLVEVETAAGRVAYGPVKARDVASLLDAGLISGGAHPLCLGKTEEIPFLKRQTRLTFARCGVIDPLSLEDYRAHRGLLGLERAIAMQPAAIVAEVTESGLRGRGGAGFPTGIKWKTVLEARGPRKYIVCNADEGDSGTFADRMIMEGDPFVLIEGMAIAGIATGATKGYIYTRSEYPHAIAVMSAAIEIARAAGVKVSFDTNLRLQLWPLARARAVMTDVMRRCDICLPSLDDVAAISGLREPDALVDWCLELGAHVVALKLGADGAIVADGKQRHHLRPHPCHPVDATGAGDTFGGAFVARLLAGDGLLDAGRYAVVAAALSTEGYGAVEPIPHAARVRAALAAARSPAAPP